MSGDAESQLKLVSLEIEDVEADAADTMSRLIPLLVNVAGVLGKIHDRRVGVSIAVTSDFEGRINRFNIEHAQKAPEFRRTRGEEGTCIGKVLERPGKGQQEYLVVLAADVWSDGLPINIVRLTYGLARLVSHIVNENNANGHLPAHADTGGAHSVFLRELGSAIVAYQNDTELASRLCRVCLQDERQKPVNLAEFVGHDAELELRTHLDMLCVFASVDVPLYRGYGLGFEDLYPTPAYLAAAMIRSAIELLVVFASEDYHGDYSKHVSGMNGYQEFLKPVWDDFMCACTCQNAAQATDRFGVIIDRVLAQLGIYVENVEAEQCYIHVQQPVVCSWSESEPGRPEDSDEPAS